MTPRRLTVLFAPDSFKGSITSVDVARALADGWGAARPDDELLLSPLADGGEGTVAAIEAAGGWQRWTTPVHDPLARRVEADWLLSADGTSAVIEMATASGLSLVEPLERNAVSATSAGTGELLRAALEQGATHINLGIGGSATTDGGRGLLDALGGVDRLDVRLKDVTLEVACDVDNPLLGDRGAAAVYGPQKGATPALVTLLDSLNADWADKLEARTGRRERDTPGAGAAGGVGFALLAIQDRFAGFALGPGIDLAMKATGFAQKLARADIVVTGEGRIDEQTAYGKTALGVARRAHEAGKPAIAVGGGVTPEGAATLAPFGGIAIPVVEAPQTIEEAMAAGTDPLRRTGERLARLISLGEAR
jgi:glycerate kinase